MMSNHVVFEIRESDERVKGLSFHSQLPWILAGLHSGAIQLWDYQSGAVLHSVSGDDAHSGLPVRSVHFHKSQPLFVSGGDDASIKVWDSDTWTCRFTLLGHSDYIRTVQFHEEQPWIVSASDDNTVRIWDWEAQSCVAILSGHTHYVMCASFHTTEDLVVTASLDHTLRVWDLSGLRSKKRSTAAAASPIPEIDPVVEPLQMEAKYVLRDHELGVDWAAFHPSLPLIASGADDHQVKLWKMDETGAWHANTLHSLHRGNVTCVLFDAKRGVVVSSSEDKSIRFWDMSKGTCIETFTRDGIKRFWVVATHPEMNLLAAGHDNGMIIFKLDVANDVDGGL